MLTKQRIKFIQSLSEKKNRSESGLFVAEGVKLVEEILRSDLTIETLYATHQWADSHSGLLQNKQIVLELITEGELDRISLLKTPNQVLALVCIPQPEASAVQLKEQLILALDDIRDPGNMGTIIRVADWFGIEHIVCSESSVDAYNPKVVQATMGSIFRVKIHYCNLQSYLSGLEKGIPVYGALLEGEDIYKQNLTPNGVIVIGNESRGISIEVQQYVTNKIMIPSFAIRSDSHAESLNASIATSILCSEFRRRG